MPPARTREEREAALAAEVDAAARAAAAAAPPLSARQRERVSALLHLRRPRTPHPLT